VQAIISHRNANPFLKEKHGWPTDVDNVREELDAYNAKICEQMGWTKYITGSGDPSPPLSIRPQQTLLQKSQRVVAGGETLVEWIASGAEAVPPEQSNARAGVCAGCRFNMEGDLSSFFTRQASEAIRKTIQLKNDMKLETSHDAKLGVCELCSCPLRLKVHLPMEKIQPKVTDEIRATLPDYCWLVKEWK
jgi:hypothetical protein